VCLVAGCGPSYRTLRLEGQRAVLDGSYGAAKRLFQLAEEKRPQRVYNLHDLGVCSVKLAQRYFQEGNHPAAMREVDDAIGYYDAAIDMHPGHQASLEGKNIALELKGQFDAALTHAEWATRFVGPSARQEIFLARELEERGDHDGALLRFRQAIAMEPDNPKAHIACAEFLLRRNQEQPAIVYLQNAYRLDPYNRKVADALLVRNAVPPLSAAQRAPSP
jgi:tetratricopeptide (TPR) repeat protein